MSTPASRPLALVTGASSGIGYELARLFAADGHDLIITATSVEGLARTAAAVTAAGAEAIVVAADLTQYEGVESLAAAIKDTGRPLEAAALNAGVGLGGYFVGGTDLAEELNMIQLNTISQVHLTKRILPDMVARGAGKLLFTASISAPCRRPTKPCTVPPKPS
jgi:short-subunit dehydrogenase